MTRRSTIAATISDSRSERSRVDAERMKRSPPPMAASTPCSTPVQNGSPTLAVTTPTIDVVPRVRSRRANWFGRKPSSAAARRTLATLSGRTLPSLLRARVHGLAGDAGAAGDVAHRRRPAVSRAGGGHRPRPLGDRARADVRSRRRAPGRRSRRPGGRPRRRRRRRRRTTAASSGRPRSRATSVAPSRASPAPIGLATSTDGAGTNASRSADRQATPWRPADTMAARAPRSTRAPAAARARAVDVDGVEVVEVDGFAAAIGDRRAPAGAERLLGLDEVGLTRSAPAAAASIKSGSR